MNNIKTFICKNSNSKFKGILNNNIIQGLISCNFVFYPNSENIFWPLNSSRYELLSDGWEEIK